MDVNEKDQKVIRAWDRSIQIVLGELFLSPSDIEFMEEASHRHILTEDDVTEMAAAELAKD